MKTLHIAILGIFLAVSLHAEPIDERRKVAFEIVEAFNVDGYDIDAFRQSFAASIEAEGKKRKSDPKEIDLMKKALGQTLAIITRERLIAMLAEGYAKQLSLDELKGILAFYKTDAGKALLAFYKTDAGKALRREEAAINREKAAQSEILFGEMMADAQKRYNELRKEKSK